MTLTVSISQFRQNISEYLTKAKEGHIIILKDDKRDQEVVQVVGKKTFNPETFAKALEASAGIFSAENHPEWKTKKDVINWVHKSRKSSERNF